MEKVVIAVIEDGMIQDVLGDTDLLVVDKDTGDVSLYGHAEITLANALLFLACLGYEQDVLARIREAN